MTLSPSQAGLPPRFKKWRRRQADALWRIVDSAKRFRCCVMPTGFGKTIVYMASALLQQQRVAVVVSTKAHEDQLLKDFTDAGLVDIRGAGNYPCILERPEDKARATKRMCDHGHCRIGVECQYRQNGCLYFDAYRRALSRDLTVTNYPYWMTQHAYGEGLGPFDTLILDEAHLAPDELSDFLSVTIFEREILLYGLGYPSRDNWRPWVFSALARMGAVLKSESVVDSVVAVKRLITSLERLKMGDPGDWVMDYTEHSLKWDVIWPFAYAEQSLFLGIKNILLVSATIRRKTLQLLGIDRKAAEWIEYPSDFPVERRPIYYLPTVKVHRKMPPEDRRKLQNRIDEIVTARKDRKGIAHTVSHDNRKAITSTTKHTSLTHSHERRQLPEALSRFMQAERGLFVSPSVTTGFDFPYRACEYIIIPKIPFPDQSSRVVMVRSQGDPDYGIYLACQTLVQSVGRGMRAKDDRCEVFILDKNWGWLYHHYESYFPRWFREALQYRHTVPPAPPRARRVDNLSMPVLNSASTIAP